MKRMVSIVKIAFLKLKFRNNLKLRGICKLSKNVSFTLKKGKISLGNSVTLSRNVHIGCVGGELIIGDMTFFNRNSIVACRNKIQIGKGCSFGPNVCIYDHNHKFNADGFKKSEYRTGEIIIGDNCWIGAGAIILKGTHIGEGCIVGAGAVINGKIPPHSLVRSNSSVLVEPLV